MPDVFGGYRNGTLTWNGLNKIIDKINYTIAICIYKLVLVGELFEEKFIAGDIFNCYNFLPLYLPLLPAVHLDFGKKFAIAIRETEIEREHG